MFRRPVLVIGLTAVIALAAACGSSTHKTTARGSAASPSIPSSSSPPASARPTAASTSPVASTSPSAAVGPAGGPVPSGFKPVSVTFVNASDGWVLGTAPCSTTPCTSIVRTRDGGRSWQGIPAPRAPLATPQAGTQLPDTVRTIRFADQSNGWVAGRAVYATHDGGQTWHSTTLPSANSEVIGLGTAAGRVYVEAQACVSDNECQGAATVYTSPISSDGWSKLVTLPASGRRPGDLVVENAGWYLPTESGIQRGSGTAAASMLPNPCPAAAGNRAIPELAVVDAQHLDAMCVGQGAAGSAQYQLYGTTDGGRTWRANGGSHLEPSDLTGIADNGHGVLLGAAVSGGSEIFRTTDDGATLPIVLSASGGGTPWTDLGFTTSSQAVVVLNLSHVYLSRDAGRTWLAVSF